MKKIIKLTLILMISITLCGCNKNELKELPKPEITEGILNTLGAGVTHLQGKGAYSRTEKEVILCVIRKYLMPKLEEIIKEVDPEAFLIVARANEIYGGGYKNILGEKY